MFNGLWLKEILLSIIISGLMRQNKGIESYWKAELIFENATFVQPSLFEKSDTMLPSCGALCTNSRSCVSFRYSKFQKRCFGYKYKFSLEDVNNSRTEDGSTYYTKKCFGEGFVFEEAIGVCYNIHTDRANWTTAMAACESEDAKLIRLVNTDIQDFMHNQINNLPSINGKNTRVDGTDSETEGTWKWWTGDMISNPLWQSNNPTGTTAKNCMCLMGINTPSFNNEINKINDCECWRLRPFICEK